MRILSEEVDVKAGNHVLKGMLALPEESKGIVIFAHGSGSSRHSPRNQFVAKELNEGGLGTLLMDLLTSSEEKEDEYSREHRFNIGLLADRLVGAIEWISKNSDTKGLKIGLFGSSTGAAGALVAAAQVKSRVGAVVSRGGRPDLAGKALGVVIAPTLLLVGGNDTQVIELNQMAFDFLNCEKKLVIVPHATHLFEEPGTLEEVARLASVWFVRYLGE